MKRGILFVICLVLLSFSVSAAVLNVSADYSTIQDAINNASNGDIINVSAGTWVESIIVNKSVAISGAGDLTIIEPLIDQNGFLVTSDGVTIQNLKIRLKTSGLDAQAIRLTGANSVTISWNVIETTGDKGIGIWIGGKGYANSNNLKINNNIITVANVSTGIYAEGGNPAQSGWEIKDNTVTVNNGNPLELYDVTDSEVSRNRMTTTSSGGSNVIWFLNYQILKISYLKTILLLVLQAVKLQLELTLGILLH